MVRILALQAEDSGSSPGRAIVTKLGKKTELGETKWTYGYLRELSWLL